MNVSRFLGLAIMVASIGAAVPASAQQVCSAAWEWIVSESHNGSVVLNCPNSGVIYSIDFASYGTPNPVPDGYNSDDYDNTSSELNPTLAPVCADPRAISTGACHASNSVDVVKAACLGQSSCEVEASNGVFGDSCVNVHKRLYAIAACGPANAGQCKKDGWKAFGIFKNQGDCVSFVATGGKNPPSGR